MRRPATRWPPQRKAPRRRGGPQRCVLVRQPHAWPQPQPFKAADTDGDGEVDLNEFKAKMAATKMAATKTVAKPSAKDKASLL